MSRRRKESRAERFLEEFHDESDDDEDDDGNPIHQDTKIFDELEPEEVFHLLALIRKYDINCRTVKEDRAKPRVVLEEWFHVISEYNYSNPAEVRKLTLADMKEACALAAIRHVHKS
jgi:hypothetical protein